MDIEAVHLQASPGTQAQVSRKKTLITKVFTKNAKKDKLEMVIQYFK